jgi:hypothetical protein
MSLRIANVFRRFTLVANAIIAGVDTEGGEVEFAITRAGSSAGLRP